MVFLLADAYIECRFEQWLIITADHFDVFLKRAVEEITLFLSMFSPVVPLFLYCLVIQN